MERGDEKRPQTDPNKDALGTARDNAAFWNMARKRFGGGALWNSNLLSRRAICTIGDICDLPSSPEGAIKIDEVCRDLRVAVGKIIFALQQLGLCRDDI
jgi:hypothetical protein